MVRILEGKTLNKKIREELAEEVKQLSFVPCLVIFQVGDKNESNLYIEKKKEFGEKIGVEVKHLKFSENISQEDLENEIKKANDDDSVQGIIVQLPLPLNLDKEKIIESINPKKDADGLTPTNLKNLTEREEIAVIPATARAVLNLFEYYGIDPSAKKVAVFGRSSLVGKPIALALSNLNANITVCHSQTENSEEIARDSDILIVAIGKPKFINQNFVNEKQIIIDIGINTIQGEKMEDEIEISRKVVGDVDFEEVKDIVSAITPVPGGVGPLTVASLFQNLLDLCRR